MIRSMMQVYVKDSINALNTYQNAFDTKPTNVHTHENGSILHAELNIYGQVLALSEAFLNVEIGNTMQFCFQFKKSDESILKNAYQILSVDAEITHPIGETFYSSLMFSLIDRFGVNWCMFLS